LLASREGELQVIEDPENTVLSLKARIAALAPLIAAEREAMDRQRRLTRPVFEAIAEAGLLRLWAPRALGGWELSPPDFMAVVEAAASLDGSIGWVVGNGGGMSRAGGYLPEAVARPWLARPDALIVATNGAIGEAVPVDGGYRVSGRWPFASGIHHATLVAPACRVSDGSGQGAILMCYVPAAHAEIIDNWRVSGLRASGSCDYTLTDVFVPVEHTHDMLQPPATQPGLPYRWPAISAFATTVAVVPLGIARAALDTFAGGLAARTRAGTTAALRDREVIQSEVGRAEVLHAAARALLISAMNELTAAIDAGGQRLVRARAMYRSACTHAAESAIRISEMVSAAAGAASIWEEHPLERQVRDIQAAAKHIAMSPNNHVVSGRICLGLDPGTQRF
jgi:alkylation response protein AidB-like acyl-CoA dehydrogenase